MRTKKGSIVSISGDKSVVVIVHTYVMHPKYLKKFRRSKKFHAHDEANTFKVGDEVVIAETRPISKLKRWRVLSQEELSQLTSK